MPDAHITASNLLAAGWKRVDGAADEFRRSPHATMFGMSELHRLIDDTRKANDAKYRG